MAFRVLRGAAVVLALGLASEAGAKTLLILDSERGDSIGQGTLRQFLPADGTFTAQRNFDDGVSVTFDGSESWSLDFAAPGPVDLQASSTRARRASRSIGRGPRAQCPATAAAATSRTAPSRSTRSPTVPAAPSTPSPPTSSSTATTPPAS